MPDTKHERIAEELKAIDFTDEYAAARIAAKLEAEYGPVELHDQRRKDLFEAAISMGNIWNGENVILNRDAWGKLQKAIAMVTIGWDNPDESTGDEERT